jgi:predicted amidohydrolase YtcJ
MQPEQALTARQALEGYTTQVAYAAGQEATRGRIAPGYDADFTVFADDPLELSPAELAPAELGVVPIVASVVAGAVVPQG